MRTWSAYIFIFLFLAANNAGAQLTWQKLASLPEGASIIDLAVDNNNRVFALTYPTGQIYYTSNNGVSWTELPGSSMISSILDIEIDKITNTLYAGTLRRGLHWTSNMGQSWQNQPFYTIQVSGDNAYIAKTARKPGTNIIVCNEPGIFSSTVYRSLNAGSSWQTLNASFSMANDLKYMNNGTLLAGTENGVFQSSDDGLTWNASNNGITNMAVSAILEKPGSSKIFAAVNFNVLNNDTSGSGVFVSTDGGATWSDVSTGMTDCAITGLAMDTLNGDLYATYYGGVYRSVNEGQSWTNVSSGIGSDDNTCIVANSAGLFTGSRKRGSAFSATPVNGWNYRNTGIVVQTISGMNMDNNGVIMTLDESNTGIHRLNGQAWTALNNGLPSSSGRKMVRDNNGVMYASYISATNCLYKSTNQGLSWTPVTTLPFPPNIYWATCPLLKVDVNNNVYVVFEVSAQLGYQPPKVYRSSDGGLTWDLVYTLDINTYISLNDIDLAADSTVYLTTTDFGMKPTILFSQGWDTVFTALPISFNQMYPTADLVLDQDDSLYIMQDNILYKRNGAGQWDSLNSSAWDPDFGLYPTKLYVDNQNRFYVTSKYAGVYFSSNDGASWSNISTGLPVYAPPLTTTIVTHIYDLCFDNNNVPYAISTDYNSNGAAGIYKYAAIPTNTTNTTGLEQLAETQVLFDVFPNPGTDLINVVFHTGENKVQIELYDSYGRKVKEQRVENGDHIVLSILDLNPGVYFLKADDGKNSHVKKILKQH